MSVFRNSYVLNVNSLLFSHNLFLNLNKIQNNAFQFKTMQQTQTYTASLAMKQTVVGSGVVMFSHRKLHFS